MQLAEFKEKFQTEWVKWTTLTPAHSRYDRTLFWVYLLFLLVGFLAVSSAAVYQDQDALAFSVRQATFMGFSLACVGFFTVIPIKWLEKSSAFITVAALVLVIITVFIAPEINGAKRWIKVFGFNFQSAEFAKLAIIIYTASFLARRKEMVENGKASLMGPIFVISLFCLFLWLGQSDTGSAVIVFVLMLSIMWVGNAKRKQFLAVILLGLVLAAIGVLVGDGYRLTRIKTYVKSLIDPAYDMQNAGYQGFSAKLAFSEGGFFGNGYGNSVMKLGYIPEAHTDFVLSIWGEEFGLLGIMFIVFLFCFFSYRIFKISRESLERGKEGRYSGFLAFGIGLWIFGQSFANLAVVSGMFPTKGLTFPFVSYGGSSFIIMSIAVAIVLRIDYENREHLQKSIAAIQKNR